MQQEEIMAIKIATPKAPPIEALPPVIQPDVLIIREQYPNIGNKIASLWGSVQLHKYLNQIIIDDRGGRQGFPQPIISALLRIFQHHSTLVPVNVGLDGTWDHAM
jgi:hypothetical protein